MVFLQKMCNFILVDNIKPKIEKDPLYNRFPWYVLICALIIIFLCYHLNCYCEFCLTDSAYIGIFVIVFIWTSFCIGCLFFEEHRPAGWLCFLILEVIICAILLSFIYLMHTTEQVVFFTMFDTYSAIISKVVWSKPELIRHSYIMLDLWKPSPEVYEYIQTVVVEKAKNPDELDRIMLDMWKKELRLAAEKNYDLLDKLIIAVDAEAVPGTEDNYRRGEPIVRKRNYNPYTAARENKKN
jgi:hypothetical protein